MTWYATLNTLNAVVPLGTAIAFHLCAKITHHGGLTFFRIGRFGGSFYVAKKGVKQH